MNIFIKSVLIKAATPFSPLLKKFPNIIWKIRYCKDYKKFPNLKKPQSFMEKILWLSLYSDTSMWSKLADKYRVREYVIDRCGEQYVNKIYGIYIGNAYIHSVRKKMKMDKEKYDLIIVENEPQYVLEIKKSQNVPVQDIKTARGPFLCQHRII